jgi:hypothetical protein
MLANRHNAVGQLSESLNWEVREALIGGGNALLFITKTYSCWKLTFATDGNRSESSIDSSSSDNDWDSDLTVTSELEQPLAE